MSLSSAFHAETAAQSAKCGISQSVCSAHIVYYFGSCLRRDIIL